MYSVIILGILPPPKQLPLALQTFHWIYIVIWKNSILPIMYASDIEKVHTIKKNMHNQM